ncbi:MAG: hypothetical protein ABIP97_06220 [Chthoniobacterales bacterium]
MGTPFLIITRTGSILEVDDRFGKRHWSGDATHPPSTLVGWAALMDAIIAAPHIPEGVNEMHSTVGWNAIYNIQNKKLKSLEVVSEISGARYRMIL